MMRPPLSRGFTLIEVLVALALVATTLGGTLSVVRAAIANQDYLERRLYADWVADNVVNTYRLEPGLLERAEKNGEQTMLGRQFTYALEVSVVAAQDDASDRPELRRITVSVGDRDAVSAPLAERVFELYVAANQL